MKAAVRIARAGGVRFYHMHHLRLADGKSPALLLVEALAVAARLRLMPMAGQQKRRGFDEDAQENRSEHIRILSDGV